MADDEAGRTPPEWGYPVPLPPPPARPPADPWGSASSPSPWGPAPVEEQSRRGRGLAFVAAAVAAVVLLASGVGIGLGVARSRSAPPAARIAPGAAGGQAAVPAVVGRVTPAVVDINTVMGLGPFGSSGSTYGTAAGTGMILTSTGEVLTNNHVIDGATRIDVTIQGRSGTYRAHVLGADPTDDVALLQIQGVSGLPTVRLAAPSSVSVGQSVIAIGNAFGRGGEPSVSQGRISALGRTVNVSDGRGGSEHLTDLIQMTAAVSPGDSGGALVNARGQVLGMITAGAFPNHGLSVSREGFAIPTTTTTTIVAQIRSGRGTSSVLLGPRGFLGILVSNVDAATATRLGLPDRAGALVVRVIPGDPAARAGITRGSVITRVDGESVATADALGTPIHAHTPGQRITVTWVDATGTHTATVALAAGPAV